MATRTLTHVDPERSVVLDFPTRNRCGCAQGEVSSELIELSAAASSDGCLRGFLVALAMEWALLMAFLIVRDLWRVLR